MEDASSYGTRQMSCESDCTGHEGIRRGNLFVVSGPSGAGKGTLVARLRQRMPEVWVSVSATTRAPRPGEIDGVHYLFMDRSSFDDLIAREGFLEWADVHGNRYGTPRGPVEDHIAQGDQVILEIDPQGAMQVRAKFPSAILVFITVPSFDELRRRLEGRGTEDVHQIERRLQTAEVEVTYEKEYDFLILNDDVDAATERLVSIVEAYASGKAVSKDDESRQEEGSR